MIELIDELNHSYKVLGLKVTIVRLSYLLWSKLQSELKERVSLSDGDSITFDKYNDIRLDQIVDSDITMKNKMEVISVLDDRKNDKLDKETTED